MGKIQLIFNEGNVKALSPISDNVAGNFTAPAMFEAQEIGLKNILGTSLLRALKAHETAGDWDAYPKYQELKDECLNYLVYQTIVYLLSKVAFKITNAGVVQTDDDNVRNVSSVKVNELEEEYQAKADFFCYELQTFLRNNLSAFPELDECHCEKIRSNLNSMSSCGIWLGGPRGNYFGDCDE